MEEKNLKKIWIISIFVILILFSMYLVFSQERTLDSENNNTKENYSIVKNYNDFYTVNSCVYRYLTYIQSSNKDALLKVLSDDFISKKGINKNNVLNNVDSLSGNVSFSSQKMFVEELSQNVFKYYVYGFIEKDIMDDFPERKEGFYIVVLDKKNEVFSIEPYDGKVFR